MKLIQLSNSDLQAMVDDEDYERCLGYKWSVYGPSVRRSKRLSYKVCKIPLANHILNIGDKVFDHKDRNFLNNQKDNLREATQKQNTWNRSIQKNKKSRYKGVSLKSDGKKWSSTITFNGRTKTIGSFILEEDAAKAYDKKAKELFGEFAFLNFPGIIQ